MLFFFLLALSLCVSPFVHSCAHAIEMNGKEVRAPETKHGDCVCLFISNEHHRVKQRQKKTAKKNAISV